MSVTLFSRTGTAPGRARLALLVAGLLAATLLASGPATARTLADLAGPLRDLALHDSPAAARLAGVQAGRVLVDVLFTSPNAAARASLESFGARVHHRRDRRVEAVVPVSRLRDIALLSTVCQVSVPSRIIPLQGTGPNLSEGVQLTNALSMQVNGVTGLGAKVAVIDVGFMGYAAAEIPPSVTVRSFRADGSIIGVPPDAHGTACAEVIADMAPGCDLSLLCVGTELDMETALDWCVANGIEIVSMSLGLVDGPFDGQSTIDTTLNRVRAQGVLVVVAAGNFAQQHWSGEFGDTNGNHFSEFAAGDEGLNVANIPGGARVSATLSWFETAGPTGGRADKTNRDYDLCLADSTGQIVARSAVTQDGDQPPSERLIAIAPAAGAYDLKILAVSDNIATGPVDKFHLFVPNYDVEPTLQKPASSLSMPAEAAGALTVAAARGAFPLNLTGIVDYPIDTLEPFSSQGPTVDGRHKPEMAGPDGVRTSLGTRPALLNPFFGTSAACPHVAGGAALLLSESGTRTADQIQAVLLRLATDQNKLSPIKLTTSVAATVDQAGVGRLSLRAGLDTEPPLVSITFPLNGSTITQAQPNIIGVVTDPQTGVDAGSIQLELDGIAYPYDAFDPGSGVVSFAPTFELGRTAHTVRLRATDLAGNQSAWAVSNFRVGLPTLSAGLHLISLPYKNLRNPSPAAIFGVPVAELGLVRWVPTDTSINKYRLYPDPLAGFTPPDAVGPNPTVNAPPAGLGYFVNLPRQVVLNIQGDSLAMTPSYNIRLPYGTSDAFNGWNLIGSPYQDALDWATVQFTTNGVRQNLDDAMKSGVTEGILFEYVPAAGSVPGHYDYAAPLAATLEPMKGYWLHVLKSTVLTIYSSTVSGTSTRPRVAARTPATLDNWQLQLVAAAPGLLDRANRLGVSPDASSGHDVAADVPEPPVLARGLSLYFPHPNWGSARGSYTQDMQARGSGPREWTVEVACPARTPQVTVSWPELNATVPGELSLRLEDLDNGRAQYMRTTSSYTYKTGGARVRHLKIVAEQAQSSGLRIGSLDASPARGGQIVVSFQLSGAASVSAEVLNIAGRPVRSLLGGRDLPAGRNTLSWDGRNAGGVPVPAGTYLLRLTARSSDGQAATRICPVTTAPR